MEGPLLDEEMRGEGMAYMNNKPKEMVSLDIDELGVIEWALEEGLKRLDEKIDEGWEPCGEKEVKRVLCKVLLRVKETKRMVKKKALGTWLSEEDQHERKDR